ncbi:hypothetical protein [Pelosinus baikalensis]|nr:hypothetical protein [Pelosinus baikalensis]
MIVIKNIRFGITESKTVVQNEDGDKLWVLVVGGMALLAIALI